MNITVPIFPCQSLEEQLAFYQTLGFSVTYQQKAPNPYAVVEKDWIRFDFYGLKQHQPGKCYHTCYLLTDEVDTLYQHFTTALRARYGKLPTRGLPRISDLRNKSSGIREFMFSDIAGNCIRIGRKLEQAPEPVYDAATQAASHRLSLALDFAYKCEDEPDEYEKVSALLDKAIQRDKSHPCANLFKAMIIRADLAIEHGDKTTAMTLLNEVSAHPFFTAHAAFFTDDAQRIRDISAKC